MDTYIEKRTVVKAVQVTDKWFSGGQPDLLPDSVKRIDSVAEIVEVVTEIGHMAIGTGCWIIEYPDSSYIVCDDKTFKMKYRRL